MKNILFILFLFVSIQSICQIQILKPKEDITVGKAKIGGITLAQLTYSTEDKDTTYTLMYKNQEFSSIADYRTIVFSGESNTLNDFYGVLKSFFTDENKKNKDYKIQVKLGKQDVLITSYRFMGATSITIYPDRGYITLTEKQVDKVFGKE